MLFLGVSYLTISLAVNSVEKENPKLPFRNLRVCVLRCLTGRGICRKHSFFSMLRASAGPGRAVSVGRDRGHLQGGRKVDSGWPLADAGRLPTGGPGPTLKAAGVADTGQHVSQPLLVPHLPTPHGCGESTAERRTRGENGRGNAQRQCQR